MQRILACPELPTLPTIAVQVLEMTRDPDVGLPQIARLVQNDTGLSTKFLRTVNSSFVGLSQPCAAIDRALGLLGMSTVTSLVLGFSLLDCTKDIESAEGFSLPQYWRRVVYGATAARHFARLFDRCDPDEVFTAGLFQDMGMLTAHVALGPEYDKVIASAPRVHTALVDVERRALGFTHAEVGAELGRRWHLPESIVACIEHHHAPDEAPAPVADLVRLVALGRMAAQSMSEETPGLELRDLLSWSNAWFDHTVENVDDMNEVFESVAEAAQDLSKVFNRDIGALPDVTSIMSDARDALVTHQLRMAQETEHLRIASMTDQLTGVGNRKKFNSTLDSCFEATRSGAT
ncbi:MAG: HDOD domain-containing protein, partial [Phycisphaerales bacterium]|nr:HDOD domain-containing protein [Phycisphaerales bacterium]